MTSFEFIITSILTYLIAYPIVGYYARFYTREVREISSLISKPKRKRKRK